MSLAAVLLILAAVATAQAVVALRYPDSHPELAMMAAILLIAISLILLDLGAAMLAGSPAPVGQVVFRPTLAAGEGSGK